LTTQPTADAPLDILTWPVLRRLLKWRHARTFFQVPVLLLSLIMILHGLLGPSLSPKNLATTLTWIHFRGVLVFVLLCAGNFFCMACPFVLVRDLARRLHPPRLNWPRKLRTKWLAIALFAGVLFAYEAFSLWSSPWWTAWLIVAYFVTIVVIDTTFKHATFCKFICPIGQFNFMAATLSPLEVKVRDHTVCGECKTNDCIRGRRVEPASLVTIQRGCELALFLPQKVGNMDCTFCLDCVQACPHDNIGILSRLPADELLEDPQRSGVGRFSRRSDIGALATLFTFGAVMNAFGMISPVYQFERWLSSLLHLRNQTTLLGIVFAFVVVIEPLLLLGGAAALAKRWSGLQRGWLAVMVRYSYGLVPIGFGMWLAHYGFHLLTGLYTIVPVTQNALAPWLGEPHWTWVGWSMRIVQPLQYGFLLLGLLGSLTLIHQFAQQDCAARWYRVFAPWAALCLILFASGVWLLSQPMDMRATFLAGKGPVAAPNVGKQSPIFSRDPGSVLPAIT
jgi:ferredoxin